MKKQLEIGDLVYRQDTVNGSLSNVPVYTKQRVIRVTARQAITDKGERFKRAIARDGGVSTVGTGNIWDTTMYLYATPEQGKKFDDENALNNLRADVRKLLLGLSVWKLNRTQLKRLKDVIATMT